MAKGIIVVDIPETCENCLFSRAHAAPLQDCLYCTVLTMGVIRKSQIKRPNWCPIRPMPEKQNNYSLYDEYYNGFNAGRNACIDKILKGE